MKGNEAYFNELSCFPLAESDEEASQRINGLVNTIKTFKENGFNVVRCSEGDNCSIFIKESYSIADFCNKNPRGTKELLLLSMIRPPYFRKDSDEETQYIEHNYKINVPDGNNLLEKDAYGLSAAYLHHSIAVNLCSCEFWNKTKRYELIEITGGKRKICHVLAFSNGNDFSSNEYFQWRVDNEPRRFLIRKGKPKDKKVCSLSSEHHGNNTLKDFAKNKLFLISYVDEVVTSINYSHASQKNFIKNIDSSTNMIDIVLVWENIKYGMRIKTTAQNEVELYQMADELEKKFNPKN